MDYESSTKARNERMTIARLQFSLVEIKGLELQHGRGVIGTLSPRIRWVDVVLGSFQAKVIAVLFYSVMRY